MQELNANYSALRGAQAKFTQSAEAVALLATEASGANRDTLVPLTSALYVPARVVPGSQLLVDIGTNFFVGKSPEAARETLLNKARLLKDNTDGLAKVMQAKQQNLEAVNEVLLNRRMQAQALQRQQAQTQGVQCGALRARGRAAWRGVAHIAWHAGEWRAAMPRLWGGSSWRGGTRN